MLDAYKQSLNKFLEISDEFGKVNKEYFESLDEDKKMIYGHYISMFVKNIVDRVEEELPSVNGSLVKDYMDEIIDTFKTESQTHSKQSL